MRAGLVPLVHGMHVQIQHITEMHIMHGSKHVLLTSSCTKIMESSRSPPLRSDAVVLASVSLSC